MISNDLRRRMIERFNTGRRAVESVPFGVQVAVLSAVILLAVDVSVVKLAASPPRRSVSAALPVASVMSLTPAPSARLDDATPLSASPSDSSSTAPTGPTSTGPMPAPTSVVLLASTLAANGIPTVALSAYQSAAAQYRQIQPACGLTWPLLAAIGRVESDHGQFHGAVLRTDGTSDPKVIGIALNGVGTALVPATPLGVTLDGDLRYDHAVGPMQIIPSTWIRYSMAGPGHSSADPFNIFDAAATAARYLCTAGGDLTTSAGQQRAVFSYNHLDTYVATVLSLEALYAGGRPTVTTSAAAALPTPPPAVVPAADPGPPPAIEPAEPSGTALPAGPPTPDAANPGASGNTDPSASDTDTGGRAAIETATTGPEPSASPTASISSTPSSANPPGK